MADEPTGTSDDPPLTTDPTPSAFPTEVGPRLIKRFMAEIRGGMGGGSLLDKLTAKQLDKLLEQTGEEGRRQHELDVQRNRMTFVLLLSLPILTVLLCFWSSITIRATCCVRSSPF